MERPIDVLNNAKGKRVLIKLKKGPQISEDNKTKLGTILVRGDNILYVSPEKGE